MDYRLLHTAQRSRARLGELSTSHGVIDTPVFMPVGTAGTVKTIQQYELEEDMQAHIILGNTYHLYLRPGTDVIGQAGGLHRFINWNGALLTDSGGYQVYSLGHRRKIDEEGVTFRSHIDGSEHRFTPERAIDIQREIGADIIMAFDECTPYPCDPIYAEQSMELTHRWLDRCIEHFARSSDVYGYRQSLAPIVQGSIYPELRRRSAEYISKTDSPVLAIGGLSVGEPHADMYSMAGLCTSILPLDRARYLMGVGTPANLLECIDLGIDMFDCVLPTRNARHGLLYTSQGIINIKNEKWKNDHDPIDPDGSHRVDRSYSRAYVRHLFQAREHLALQIASLHNISFYLWLMKEARRHIADDSFAEWKQEMVQRITKRL